jgi:hypothetical protein
MFSYRTLAVTMLPVSSEFLVDPAGHSELAGTGGDHGKSRAFSHTGAGCGKDAHADLDLAALHEELDRMLKASA